MEEAVSTVVRVMSRGSGFPSLVQTDSGRHFVMKLSGVGQGVSGLLSEFIATRLANLLGLKVPRVAPILLPKGLPWQVGTDEFYEALQRSSGWNLGVEFVDHARDLTIDDLEEIPSGFLDQLAAVDAVLQNVDRTRKNPNLLIDRKGDHWAMDFGACLFLERFARLGAQMHFDLPTNHFLAGRRVRPAELEDPSLALREIVGDLPDSWIDSIPGDRQALIERLGRFIQLYVRRHDQASDSGTQVPY